MRSRRGLTDIYVPRAYSATLSVAASDASDKSKAQADYVCDGVADEVQIHAALSALPVVGGRIALSEGTFTTAATIALVQFSELILTQGTTIVPATDFNVVSVDNDSRIEGGAITTSGVGGFSSAAIFFDCANQYHGQNLTSRPCGAWRMQLNGGISEGHAIHFLADDNAGGEYATNVKAVDITIRQFQDGVRLEVISPAAGINFINGNIFERVTTYNTEYALRLIGSNAVPAQVNGNDFIGCHVQAGGVSVRAIDCDGAHNLFTNFHIWDWAAAVGAIAIEFTATGQGNYVSGQMEEAGLIQDDGATFKNEIWRTLTGFESQRTGTGSIASGTTSDVIAHGLAQAPTIGNITITLAEDPDNTPGAIWVDTIGAANFTVNCENDPGASNLDFGWKASWLPQ